MGQRPGGRRPCGDAQQPGQEDAPCRPEGHRPAWGSVVLDVSRLDATTGVAAGPTTVGGAGLAVLRAARRSQPPPAPNVGRPVWYRLDGVWPASLLGRVVNNGRRERPGTAGSLTSPWAYRPVGMAGETQRIDLVLGCERLSLSESSAVWLVGQLWQARLPDSRRGHAIQVARMIDRELVEPGHRRAGAQLDEGRDLDVLHRVLDDCILQGRDLPAGVSAVYMLLDGRRDGLLR